MSSDTNFDKDARRRVAARFFVVFDDWQDEKIAEEFTQLGIKVSRRTVQRARTGATVPNPDLARAMQRKLDTATMTEEERYARFEAERARREKIQRQEQAFIRDENKRDDYPKWVDDAFARYKAREFDVMIQIMDGRIGPDGAPDLRSEYLPFVLNLQATAYLEKGGQNHTAEDLFNQALEACDDPEYHANVSIAIKSNLALCMMFIGKYALAMDRLEEIIEQRPDHAPAYYNALCIAAALVNADSLNVWLGRTQAAAQLHFDLATLTEFLRRAQNDPDLAFARSLVTWPDFEAALQKLQILKQNARRNKGNGKDEGDDSPVPVI